MKNEIISREAQEAAGLLRKVERGYVPAIPEQRTQRVPDLPPAVTSHSTVLDVPANAIQVVSVQTTEVDRANGYLRRSIPLYVAFGVGMTIIAITLFEEPVLSATTFIVFWLATVGAWMYGEWRSAQSSPYAANLTEIKRKWDNIDFNDKRRWDAWEKVTGIVVPTGAGGWVERHKWLIISWAVVTLLWLIFVGLVVVSGALRRM